MSERKTDFEHENINVYSTIIKIPTYLMGAENPNPSLFESGVKRVYPYRRKDAFTEKIENREYDAVVIESPFMEVTILPDWGFHVYRAIDKIS